MPERIPLLRYERLLHIDLFLQVLDRINNLTFTRARR